jgi:hypothetical protein
MCPEGGEESHGSIQGHGAFFSVCILCLDDKQLTPPFVGRQVNAHNWDMNLRFKTNAYPNPVKQNYPGRADTISLQSGFALYLLRNRKDMGMSKLQEIFDKVDEIGNELA